MNTALSMACKSFWCASIAIWFFQPVLAQTAKVSLDRIVVQTATITDSVAIDFFVNDLMIAEKQITKLTVFDLNSDGFGEGDVARAFPSNEIYFLVPGKKARAIMSAWSTGDKVKSITNPGNSPERFKNAPDSVRTPPLESFRPQKSKSR